MTRDVFIVSAVRTPIGKLNGSLSSMKAHQLGAVVIKEVVSRAKVHVDDVDEVIFGQVLAAGHGMNPARQASLAAGIPEKTPAWGLNMVCGSGLKAIAVGAQAIKDSDADIIVAGGQESMSLAPHTVHMREGVKFGNVPLKDSLIDDGLTDAMLHCHMGITAENVASKWEISREEQDSFAFESQRRCGIAQTNGYFREEIVHVDIADRRDTIRVDTDEQPRADTTVSGLAKLKPAFKTDGTVTAGNACMLGDGAAALLLASGEQVRKLHLKPMAKIVAFAQTGVSPSVMGTGPIPAIKLALEKSSWTKESVDLFELNEAFAGVSVAVIRDLGLDMQKVNIQGGAIALGHPLGASGARIVTTLLHSLQRTGGKRGVAALCVGGGMGVALCVETV